jgi:hypothetical protein
MEEFPSVIRGNAVFGILVSVVSVMMICALRETRLTSLNDDTLTTTTTARFFCKCERAFSSKEVLSVCAL